ncbi:extracellular solute-binding protein [Agromyces badenianii]|uniref:extracellular solute-binding protein n=1 Tax=Agromyces badenianii TaxID=2080742 RepID=UPI000D592289|nr:extracellular solute-binding protein [Agromyces badenianii]PWC05328.1 hypothetical protein DCE94_03320 [Agromyces badenianii]
MNQGTKGTKQSLRVTNEQLVLQHIAAANAQASRADIARSTGLTRATVSAIVAELIERRIVAEAGTRAGDSGKPATRLELDRVNHIVIAIDVRARQVTCTCVLLDGTVDEFTEYSVGTTPIIDVVAVAVASLRRRRPENVLSVGIAVPGGVSGDGRVVSHELGWDGLDIAALISEQVEAPVFVMSDAAASAVFEATLSRAVSPSIGAIHLGKTLSVAMLARGVNLIEPAQSGGDIGHLIVLGGDRVCPLGHAGCLSAVASLDAILDGVDPETLFLRHNGVTNGAVRVLNSRIADASRHIAAYVDILGATSGIPEFVLDGPVRALGSALVEATRKELRARVVRQGDIPVVRFSTLGADGVILGAATHAFRQRLGVTWTTENLSNALGDTSLTLVERNIGGYSMERLPIVRKYVSAAAVAALALGAAGCSTGAGGDDTITLEVWTHEFEPLQQVLTEKWIPEFEAEHEGVQIKLTSIPFAGAVSYDAKLISALSSGGGPDVWDMGDWNYKTFAENGYLEPIDPETFGYEDDQELIDAYLPGSTDALVSDGELLGLFSEFNTLNLFYNKEVFADAGIEPLPEDKPVSWKEIGEIGQKLRVENGGALERIGLQLGFFANFRSPQWYAQNYYTFLRQYGQDDIFVDGAPAGNTEAAVEAFQLIHDFTYKYEAYDPNFLNNWFADVPQGRAGMVSAGTWYPSSAIQNNEDFDFGVAPNPVVDPENPDTYKNVSWLWGWSINANAEEERKAASQEFLAFMLGKKGETEQSADWFERLGYMQPSLAFLESDAYQSALEESPWLQLWVDALSNYEVTPVPHSYDEAGAALVRAIDRVIYDGASAEEAADQLQAELERLG